MFMLHWAKAGKLRQERTGKTFLLKRIRPAFTAAWRGKKKRRRAEQVPLQQKKGRLPATGEARNGTNAAAGNGEGFLTAETNMQRSPVAAKLGGFSCSNIQGRLLNLYFI